MKRGKLRSVFMFNASQSTLEDGQTVVLEDTCKQDENGENVRMEVNVTVYGDEEEDDEDEDDDQDGDGDDDQDGDEDGD